MNIQKENIYMNKVKTKNMYQIALDNDYIISDIKPDINKIVREQGEVIIDECKVHTDKIEVKGRVRVAVLYLSDDENMMINSAVEYLNFYENINMPGVNTGDIVNIKGELDDVTINIINSRKISIKALINLNSVVNEAICYDAIVDVVDDEMIQKQSKEINLTKLEINKKDVYRIKDEIVLQSSKKNISEILYYDVHMPKCNTRMCDEMIGLRGEIIVFILYLTEEGEYECLEKEITYNGDVELYEARENMIDDIYACIMEKDISARPDDDGERRIIDIDVTLNLDIKCYKDEKIEVLNDAYSLDSNIKLEEQEIEYETLMLKNCSSFKVEDTIKLKNSEYDILQVCNSTGNVKIDEIEMIENGLNIEGVIEINIIYISNKDNCPISSVKEMIPFSHIIEVDNITDESVYSIKSYVEQVSVVTSSGNSLDIKVSISIDTIVFSRNKEIVPCNINQTEIDKNEWNKMASIIGYIVKEGEDLWSIAKRFYMSVDMLKKTNNIVDKTLKKGDKLLIMKQRL